jgi:phosphonate metabolism protein PhnN/1,5-bisphosphokinase (PRPP-forming)
MVAMQRDEQKSTTRGRLVLVVGPSGSGKDTLLNAARARLRGDGRFRFPRRTITRAAEAGGEDFDAVCLEEFEARRVANRFALAWTAHGLHYGIPDDIDRDLVRGTTVVVNVSRIVVAEARIRYTGVAAILVTADIATIARRLAARGRESAPDIARRLARVNQIEIDGPDVTIVRNNGALADAERVFIAALRSYAGVEPMG